MSIAPVFLSTFIEVHLTNNKLNLIKMSISFGKCWNIYLWNYWLKMMNISITPQIFVIYPFISLPQVTTDLSVTIDYFEFPSFIKK